MVATWALVALICASVPRHAARSPNVILDALPLRRMADARVVDFLRGQRDGARRGCTVVALGQILDLHVLQPLHHVVDGLRTHVATSVAQEETWHLCTATESGADDVHPGADGGRLFHR